MRYLFSILAFIVLLSFSLGASAERNIFLVRMTMKGAREVMEEKAQEKLDENFREVTNSLGKLYGDFQLMADAAGGYGQLHGLISKIQQSFGANEHAQQFETDLDRATDLFTRLTRRSTYKLGGSIKNSQVRLFRKRMPSRYDSDKVFRDKLRVLIKLVFPGQEYNFYNNVIMRIVEVAEKHKLNKQFKP